MDIKHFVKSGGDLKSTLNHDQAGVLADGVRSNHYLEDGITYIVTHRNVLEMSRDLRKLLLRNFTFLTAGGVLTVGAAVLPPPPPVPVSNLTFLHTIS